MAPLRDLSIAIQFLTRLPVRLDNPWAMDDLAASVPTFPIVGAVVGLLGSLVYAAAVFCNLPPALAAVIAVSALVLVTGALHEDGLADITDGFGGGRTRDDKLRIMRDSRLGSYGTIGLMLSLAARVGCLAALADPGPVAAALIAAAALSRAAMPLAMATMPQAREDGLAARAGRPHPGRAAAGLAIAMLIVVLVLPLGSALIAAIASGVAGSVLLVLARRQIGGITGDVLGALQQVVEIACLLALTATMRVIA